MTAKPAETKDMGKKKDDLPIENIPTIVVPVDLVGETGLSQIVQTIQHKSHSKFYE